MRSSKNGWIEGRHPFRYFQLSSHALLLEWPAARDRSTLLKINQLTTQLENQNINGIIDMVPGYHSLTLYHQSRTINGEQLIDLIEQLEIRKSKLKSIKEAVTVPVVYDLEANHDLSDVAAHLDMTMEEVIAIHTAPTYDVHFIGFLPGFLYLGGLDDRLVIPRRETPRIRVPAGSVAIAAGQTGIYPIESPGGWHIIGHTDMTLFDPFATPPCPITSGMRIKFEATASL